LVDCICDFSYSRNTDWSSALLLLVARVKNPLHAGLALARNYPYNRAFKAPRDQRAERNWRCAGFFGALVIQDQFCPGFLPRARNLSAWRRPMAVPMKKVSRQKRGSRRSHDTLSAPAYVEDKESGERRRPHHIDLKSGKYRGRQILEPKSEV